MCKINKLVQKLLTERTRFSVHHGSTGTCRSTAHVVFFSLSCLWRGGATAVQLLISYIRSPKVIGANYFDTDTGCTCSLAWPNVCVHVHQGVVLQYPALYDSLMYMTYIQYNESTRKHSYHKHQVPKRTKNCTSTSTCTSLYSP